MEAYCESKGPKFGARHHQVGLLFCAIMVNYGSRLAVSLSLVAMTDAATTNPNFQEFDWNEKERSYILSTFFWGYIITQLPGGCFARKFGVKITLFVSTFGSSLVSLLVPVCIPWGGWQIFCCIRIIQGLFQGMLFPCVYEHLGKWSPAYERTRLGGICNIGSQIGTILGMGLTGFIAASNLGWPGIYYVFGGIGIVFCTFWMVFADYNPSVSRFITPEEKKYILVSQSKIEKSSETKFPVPWKAIFTSIPFLSLLVVRISDEFANITLQTQTSVYFHGVLQMDMKSNGLYSTLPYLVSLISSCLYVAGSDIILQKKWASLTVVRKSFNTLAMWGSAALLVFIGFLDKTQIMLAIALMTVTGGLNAGHNVGDLLNIIDLSPNHSGILMGIINPISTSVSILTPLIVGLIVSDETARSQWQLVFLIAAVLCFFGNLLYIILGTAETQPWDSDDFLFKNDDKQNICLRKKSRLKGESNCCFLNNLNCTAYRPVKAISKS